MKVSKGLTCINSPFMPVGSDDHRMTVSEMWNRLNEVGGRIPRRTADLAGAPRAIILFAVFCAGWYLGAGAAG